MSFRKDVLELLRLYEGENPREAFKPTTPYEADGVTFRRPRDRRDNKWITEDPVAGRWLVFRTQVPDHLEPAYEIALGEGLLEQYLLKPEQQDGLYRSHGLPGVPQDQPWPVVPTWRDALVLITDKGYAVLAEARIGMGMEPEGTLPDDPSLSESDVKVLLYLHEQHPILKQQADIEAGAELSRGTIGPCLEYLRKAELVYRPKGERKGDGLTTEGMKMAERLAHIPPR